MSFFRKPDIQKLAQLLMSKNPMDYKHKSLKTIEDALSREKSIENDIQRFGSKTEEIKKLLEDLKFKLQPSQSISEDEKREIIDRLSDLGNEIEKELRHLEKDSYKLE